MSGQAGPSPHRVGAVFWLTAIVGWAVIGYGVRGMFQHHIDTRPADLIKFAIGGALLHDVAFAPLVLLAGVLLARTVGGRGRAVIQGALIISGCLALFSYPLVRDYARVIRNPTSLPFNYTVNLAVVLGVVWAVASVMAAVRLRGRGRPAGR